MYFVGAIPVGPYAHGNATSSVDEENPSHRARPGEAHGEPPDGIDVVVVSEFGVPEERDACKGEYPDGEKERDGGNAGVDEDGDLVGLLLGHGNILPEV